MAFIMSTLLSCTLAFRCINVSAPSLSQSTKIPNYARTPMHGTDHLRRSTSWQQSVWRVRSCTTCTTSDSGKSTPGPTALRQRVARVEQQKVHCHLFVSFVISHDFRTNLFIAANTIKTATLPGSQDDQTHAMAPWLIQRSSFLSNIHHSKDPSALYHISGPAVV
jgi:hypothetical protein